MRISTKEKKWEELEISSNGHTLKGRIYNVDNVTISKYVQIMSLIDKIQRSNNVYETTMCILDILMLCIEGINREELENALTPAEMQELLRYITQTQEEEKKTSGNIS